MSKPCLGVLSVLKFYLQFRQERQHYFFHSYLKCTPLLQWVPFKYDYLLDKVIFLFFLNKSSIIQYTYSRLQFFFLLVNSETRKRK